MDNNSKIVISTKNIYLDMVNRCKNPSHHAYKYYGGRGIKVCDRWKEPSGFENFISDIGLRPENLTLDRIDNSKGYSPDNCRWTSMRVQSINKRLYSNNKSGCKGVHLHKQSGKWRAKIMLDGKYIDLGLHQSLKSATRARKQAEELYFKPILANS